MTEQYRGFLPMDSERSGPPCLGIIEESHRINSPKGRISEEKTLNIIQGKTAFGKLYLQYHPLVFNLTVVDLRENPVVTVDLTLRSEEHTSELQSLMRISYAVFCLKKKKNHNIKQTPH